MKGEVQRVVKGEREMQRVVKGEREVQRVVKGEMQSVVNMHSVGPEDMEEERGK